MILHPAARTAMCLVLLGRGNGERVPTPARDGRAGSVRFTAVVLKEGGGPALLVLQP